MRKKKKASGKISIEDYIRAVKKTDREIQLEQSPGWVRTTKVHKSKKVYDRKSNKRSNFEE